MGLFVLRKGSINRWGDIAVTIFKHQPDVVKCTDVPRFSCLFVESHCALFIARTVVEVGASGVSLLEAPDLRSFFVASECYFHIAVNAVPVLVELTQIEVTVGLNLPVLFRLILQITVVYFEDALSEGVGCLREHCVVFAVCAVGILEGRAELQKAKVVNCLDEALVGALLVVDKSLIPIFFDSKAELVANSEVADRPGVTSLSRFSEPCGGLIVVFLIIEK